MKRLLVCLLLAAALVTNACALEVPTDTTVRNLNGSQQLIKTYTLPPGADPQTLIEDPFEQEGWRYTFADIVKEENQVSDRKYHTETVTLETDTKDLGTILTQLAATLDYDDGTYSGVLNLDHTAIRSEAAGYTSQARTVTATKTIGPLDRNDMSYVPATTVKDGVTLNLSNVDWQVIGTDLVGDALAPASYQAVATYSGKSYHKVATGYVTSADYVGEITRSDVETGTSRTRAPASGPPILSTSWPGAPPASLRASISPRAAWLWSLAACRCGTGRTRRAISAAPLRSSRRSEEHTSELHSLDRISV